MTLKRDPTALDAEARKPYAAPEVQSVVAPLAPRANNAFVRSVQLDEDLCLALSAWQVEHAVRSASAAIRLLLEQALLAAGTLDVEKRVAVARTGALRAARVAMLSALEGLSNED